MHKIKAVIFDLDGTLANTIPLCVESFRQSIEPIINRKLSDEEIIAAFGPDEEGTIKSFVSKDYKKAVSDFMRIYEDLHHQYTKPFDGIVDLLSSLKEKGIKLALATGKGKYTTQLSLKYFGLLSFFERIETGSPEGSRKVEAIQNIVASFPGLTKDETLYVGDTAGDVKESRKAGIAVVSAAWAETAKKEELKKENPDEIFDTVAEFADWLSKK